MKIVVLFYVSYCHLVSMFDRIKSFNHKNKMHTKRTKRTEAYAQKWLQHVLENYLEKVSKMLVICISNAICIFLFCLYQEKAKRLLEILSEQ